MNGFVYFENNGTSRMRARREWHQPWQAVHNIHGLYVRHQVRTFEPPHLISDKRILAIMITDQQDGIYDKNDAQTA